jgi:hypothetical protein
VTEERAPNAAPERHSLAVCFEEFGWHALEDAARRENESVESLIADACRYFAREVEVDRVAARLLPIRAGGGTPRDLELHLPSRTWRLLVQESARQSAELSRIVEHASLLYLADVESGRAARRILEAEDGD